MFGQPRPAGAVSDARCRRAIGCAPAWIQPGARRAKPPGFIQALSVARPDLARKMAAKWGPLIRTASTDAAASIDPPNFLFGYAWEKTSEYIGSYGDLNTQLAWKYLVANLKPGSGF